MMIWENFSGPGIYKIHNLYPDAYNPPPASGHNVQAESPTDALRIAKKYGIANPFDRKVFWRKVRAKFDNVKECLQGSKSGIWAEENGELVNIRERLEKEPDRTTRKG